MIDSFVYIWTDIRNGKIYIGSRKGMPTDGYICSSRYLLVDLINRPTDFYRVIIDFGNWTSMRILEDELIREAWAENISCYNKQSGGMFKIDSAMCANMSLASLGRPKEEEHRKNIEIANQKKANDPKILEKLRKPKCTNHGANVSKATKGVSKSKEHCDAMSSAKLGVSTGPCSSLRRLAIIAATKGLLSPFRDMTYEEIMGPDKAEKLRASRSATMKDICAKRIDITCPHCSYKGHGPNMKRWHFNKCKNKV
jgi:hypothetical protein